MANFALKETITRGTSYAIGEVRRRYDNPLNPRDNLPYHSPRHTVEVMARTNTILKTIAQACPRTLRTRDLYLARLGAAFHDIDQTWEEVVDLTHQFPIVKRRRKVGDVERRSFEEAKEFMDKENSRGRVFSSYDYAVVEASIMATVPHFENGTVVQPNVTDSSPLIAQAIALADLGVAGMEGFSYFLRDTNDLFKEDNLDVVDILLEKRQLSEAHKRYLKDRIMDGTQRQLHFAEGRRNQLDPELLKLPSASREAVRRLFNKFPETIEGMVRTLNQRKGLSYDELISSMA